MKNKLLVFLTCCILILGLTGCGKTEKTKNGKKIKITPSESSQIEYEDYDNGLISLKIPKGWKVEIPQVDYIHYTFKVYNPDNKDYMFIFGLKLEGFLKSEKARSTFAKLYPDAVFSKLSPIDPQTTEGFYKVWNSNAKLANDIDLKYEYFPYFTDFEVIDTLGRTNLGGDILRATFKSDSGTAMQGLFTASVYDAGSYYMYGVDLAPLNVYNIIMMMAPDEDFINYQEIYDKCLGTLTFSNTFMNGFNNAEANLVSTVNANQKIYDEMSDMIMDSWEKRNNSYDIISQKQSDATLGYERVYDTETNEVYRAYNGFTDEYKGNRYQSIPDDMYTSAISGYIVK